MEKVVIKRVDSQGRIVIPKEWRDKFNIDEFILVLKDDRIELYPRASNLTKLIDSIDVEELPSDWQIVSSLSYKFWD
jgi:looped-hinge helix DNA binding domain, AbrB family